MIKATTRWKIVVIVIRIAIKSVTAVISKKAIVAVIAMQTTVAVIVAAIKSTEQ